MTNKSLLAQYEEMLGYTEPAEHQGTAQELQEKRIRSRSLPKLPLTQKSNRIAVVSWLAIAAAAAFVVFFQGDDSGEELISPKGTGSLVVYRVSEESLKPLHSPSLQAGEEFVLKLTMTKAVTVWFEFFDGRGDPLGSLQDLAASQVHISQPGSHFLGGTYSLDHDDREESVRGLFCSQPLPIESVRNLLVTRGTATSQKEEKAACSFFEARLR